MRCLLTLLLLAATASIAASGNAAHAFLAASFDISAAEIARIDAGRVVSRTLDATSEREVGTLGVVRIRVAPDVYVRRLSDIVAFKRTDAILQIGTFANPAAAADVAAMTLEESEVRSLQRCRVGDCSMQLSAEAIGRFQREVNWARPDASRDANAVMRLLLLDYVTRYRQSGAGGLQPYADRAHGVNPRSELESLVSADAAVWREFPALRQHVVDYPAAEGAGITDVMYWSKEIVGRRPVVSVTHLAIAPAPDDSPAAYGIASRQIYGAHYFDASLGLTVLVRDPHAADAVYVAYLNRSRIDVISGVFGGIARTVISGRARGLVAEQLARLQRTLEGRRATAPSGDE